MQISWIGLGKLGLPCAELMAQAGYRVQGYDINPVTSEYIAVKHNIAEAVQESDLIFVAVPTPHAANYDGSVPTSDLPPQDFDYGTVASVLATVNAVLKPNQTVVLVSTVLPGTIRKQLAHLITNSSLVYNPYFIALGSVAWDAVNPEMVVIGTEDGSRPEVLIDLYRNLLKNQAPIHVGTWEEAESIKLFYNTWISAKLGLVNMIQDVAMRLGHVHVDTVTDALKGATKRITGPQYMTAGLGDGGACHPRDNIALKYLAKELNLGYDLFDSIMHAREMQAKNLAQFLVEQCAKYNLPLVIHGRSYKPGVPYIDGSYSLLIAYYCNQLGIQPMFVDPLTGDNPEINTPVVMLLAHCAKVTYEYANLKHSDVLYCIPPGGSVIVDPWRRFPKNNKNFTVLHYGDSKNV